MDFDINDFSKQFVKAAQKDTEQAAELLAVKAKVARLLDETKPSLKKSFETTVSKELSQVATVQIVDDTPLVVVKGGDYKVEKAVQRAYEKLKQEEELKNALCPA